MRLSSFRVGVLRAAVSLALAMSAGCWMATAHAEDAATEPAQSAVAAAAPTWTGFYVGGHGELTRFINPPLHGLEFDRASGGVHGGWNYQNGNSVLGIELDYTYEPVFGSRTDNFGPPIGNVVRGIGIDDLASVRVRYGGFIADNLLLYGSFGYAYAVATKSLDVPAPAPPFAPLHKQRSYDFGGIVAGAGVEYRFSPQISGRVEGFKYFLDEFDGHGTIKADVFRAGLTLHFPSN
jgi:outer membrane immunogenic protein